MALFLVVELLVGSLEWVSSSIVCSLVVLASGNVDLWMGGSLVLFMSPSGGYGGFNFLSLLNHCSVRSITRTVAVVVMLADYLPEMQRVHLITLIIMVGIVNFSARIHRQVFLSVYFNEIDRPTSETDQGIVCY